jgi:hypothetical protein
MKRLRYRNKPIGSIKSLAATLGFQENRLIKVTESTQDFYRPNAPKIKPNGKIRQTYTIKEPLRYIQEKILHEIIDHVDFPDYLQGGVRDTEIPRDYIRDADLHAGREIVLKEDISSFFSTTRSDLVYKVWKYFFKFPHEVAEMLTKLTTYKGFIPEGSPTSTTISNLVFWDCEPALEDSFRQKGYIYSRYVDDITVSFATRIDKRELQTVTELIYGMFFRAGVKPNRKKRDVQSKQVKIHNLNMDSGKPTLPKATRNKIRAAVQHFEVLANTENSWSAVEKEYNKVRGKVQLLKRLHPDEAQKYIEKIKKLKGQILLRSNRQDFKQMETP